MRRPRRTWGQRLLIAFNCVLVLVCIASAATLTWVERAASSVPRYSLGAVLSQDKPASEPQNILLVGIDDGAGLPSDDPVLLGRSTSANTDTIMILRVEPGSDKASLLSLPRDLWVQIGDTGSSGRINSAMAQGGPEMLIETINTNFGIGIDHFVQVNLAGFRQLVEAVDGVPIYFPWAARDRKSGLAIEEPGCVTLDPDQALGFTRSRYFEKEVDGEWISDPQSDLSRIQRQQMFSKAVLKRAINKGVRNPFTLNSLVGVAQQSVIIDDQLTTQQIVDLGGEFRDFDPDSLALYTPPTVGKLVGEAQVLELVDAEAQPIFDIFRGVAPAADVPAAVRVEVRNGTGVAGQGVDALDAFGERGFVAVRSADDDELGAATTVVRYAPGQADQAVEVARYLDGSPRLVEDAEVPSDVSVVVVTGSDFTAVRTDPRPAEDFTDQVAGDAGAPVEETPTTVNEFVPATPPDVSCG